MTNPEKTIWRTKKIKTVLNSGGPGLSFAPCYGFFLLSSPDIVKIHATLMYIKLTIWETTPYTGAKLMVPEVSLLVPVRRWDRTNIYI